MGRIALGAVIALLAIGALWIGGELHRKNCIAEGQSGCSALPWVNGHPPAPSTLGMICVDQNEVRHYLGEPEIHCE